MPKRPLETDNCPSVEVKKGVGEKSHLEKSLKEGYEARLEEHATKEGKEIKAREARIEVIEEPSKITNQSDLENKIADLRKEKEKEVKKLRIEKENEIADLRKENEKGMEGLRNDMEKELKALRKKNFELEKFSHKTEYAKEDVNMEVQRLQRHVAGLKKYKRKYDDLKEQKERMREEILNEDNEVKEQIKDRIRQLEEENKRLVEAKEIKKEMIESYEPGTPRLDVAAVMEDNKKLREQGKEDRDIRHKLNEQIVEYETRNKELMGQLEWYKKGWLIYHQYSREQINLNSHCEYVLPLESIPMPPPPSHNPLAMPPIVMPPPSPMPHSSPMPPPSPMPSFSGPFFPPPSPRPFPRPSPRLHPRSSSVFSRHPSFSHQSHRPNRVFTTEVINKK